LTGSKQMDATAILDYFAPLQKWLDEQNKGEQPLVIYDPIQKAAHFRSLHQGPNPDPSQRWTQQPRVSSKLRLPGLGSTSAGSRMRSIR